MGASFWNKHINYPSNRQVIFAILFICISACAILIYFQPFGVNNYDPSEKISWMLVLAVSTLGLLMGIVFVINELVIRPRVLRQYTNLTIAIWLLWGLVLGGSAAYLQYNFLGNFHDWNFRSYLDFVKNWAALTIIPLSIVLLYFRQHTLEQELQEATIDADDSAQLFIFTADNQKDRIALPIRDILFLESQDNYVSLSYLSGDEVKRHLLRSTLKRMEKELTDTPVIRCHRSFLVNPDNVLSFKGNAHRLELTMKNVDSTIPVSRNFTSEMMSILG